MCVRRENEVWWSYAVRTIIEQPRALMSIVGIAAATVIYCDWRSYVYAQTDVLQANTEAIQYVLSEMKENNIRMANIESYHKQK